jgi:hypothetical protein
LKANTHLLDLSVKCVKVNEQVDASSGKDVHARFVVGDWINMVHPKGIGTQSFHEVGITLTLRAIDQRIIRHKLIGNSFDIPLVAFAGEEFGTLDVYGRNGLGDTEKSSQYQRESKHFVFGVREIISSEKIMRRVAASVLFSN